MLLLLSFFFISFQNIFASRKHFNTQCFSHTTYCNRFSLFVLYNLKSWAEPTFFQRWKCKRVCVSHRKEEEVCSYLEQTNWTSAFNFSKIGLHCRWFSLNLSLKVFRVVLQTTSGGLLLKILTLECIWMCVVIYVVILCVFM